MATAKPKRKSGLKRAPAKRTPRKAKPGTRGLLPAECRLDPLPAEAEEVRARIERGDRRATPHTPWPLVHPPP